MSQKSSNVVWHESTVTRKQREEKNRHKGAVLWFTGLSGSGKSTLANEVAVQLHNMGCNTYVLDGDNIRHGLNGDLGFSPEDRKENIRRIGEVAKLFVDSGTIVCTAFISPYQEDRDRARSIMQDGDFFEIYAECDLAECEKRDPKGLYKKARDGVIKEFTGISAPYEAPDKPEISVRTDKANVEECAKEIIDSLREKQIINK